MHQSYKRECVRPETPLSLDDAKRETEKYVNHYNNERLHGAIGYVTPVDKLEGRAQLIFDERKRKLAAAQERRKTKKSSRLVEEQNRSNDMKPIDISIDTEESPAAG
ncbi:MAG: transposase [Magnetococcales bacterium]|nr:transposase [Magnetococcales bacterium]